MCLMFLLVAEGFLSFIFITPSRMYAYYLLTSISIGVSVYVCFSNSILPSFGVLICRAMGDVSDRIGRPTDNGQVLFFWDSREYYCYFGGIKCYYFFLFISHSVYEILYCIQYPVLHLLLALFLSFGRLV